MFGLLSLAVTAIGKIAGVRQQKKATAAQREGQRIQTASETVTNRLARRRAAKEARIMQARVQQSSANSGVSGSSGELGAMGAIGGNFARNVALQQANILTIAGLSRQNQRAADALSKADRIEAFTKLGVQALNVAEDSGVFS